MLKSNRLTVALSIGILFFLLAGAFLVQPKPKDYPPFISSSPDVDGVKGLYLLLKEKQRPVQSWEQEWRSLPKATNQCLVVIEPLGVNPIDQEMVQKWVEQGNDLLLFDSEPQEFLSMITVGSKSQNGNPQLKNIKGNEMGRMVSYKGEVGNPNRLTGIQTGDVLLSDDEGVLAGITRVGKGRIIAFLDPEWLMNQNILRLSHFAMVWPTFQKNWDAIWFDDYHHGIQKKPGLLAIYPAWLMAIFLQLLLAMFLWLWWKGTRFGPVYTPREWVVRRGDETLLAVASWYQRKKLAKDALFHQERYVRKLLRDRWGLGTQASHEQIAYAAKRRWDSQKVNRLTKLFTHLDEVKRTERYNAKLLIQDTQEIEPIIQALKKEFHVGTTL